MAGKGRNEGGETESQRVGSWGGGGEGPWGWGMGARELGRAERRAFRLPSMHSSGLDLRRSPDHPQIILLVFLLIFVAGSDLPCLWISRSQPVFVFSVYWFSVTGASSLCPISLLFSVHSSQTVEQLS